MMCAEISSGEFLHNFRNVCDATAAELDLALPDDLLVEERHMFKDKY